MSDWQSPDTWTGIIGAVTALVTAVGYVRHRRRSMRPPPPPVRRKGAPISIEPEPYAEPCEERTPLPPRKRKP